MSALFAQRASSSALASRPSCSARMPTLLSTRGRVALPVVRSVPEQQGEPNPTPNPPTGATPGLGPVANPPTPLDLLPEGTDLQPVKNTLSWYGPAPETINGRLAMLGFVAALGAEIANGTPLWEQITSAKWPVAATFVTFIVASLIPIFRGANLEKGWGIFQKRTELINGRAAMFGLVALAVTELLRGGALFSPAGTPLESTVNASKNNVERFENTRPGQAVRSGVDSIKDKSASMKQSPFV